MDRTQGYLKTLLYKVISKFVTNKRNSRLVEQP